MKINRYLLWATLFLTSAYFTQGCALFSGDDEQQVDEIEGDEEFEQGDEDQEDEQYEDQDGDQEENDASNLAENQGINNLANNESGILGAEGLGVPDNIQNEGLANNAAIPANENIAGIDELNGLISQNNTDATIAESAPPSGIPESAPLETIPTDIAEAPQPAAAPASFEASDAKVYYVLPGGAELKDSPEGSTVGSLEQGAPCLATIEGEWANLPNRGYVRISQLSPEPVGRSQDANSWQ